MRFLRTLLDFLFPAGVHETRVANATLATLGAHACATRLSATNVSLLPYEASLVKACIIEAKFRDSERAGLLLARVLADYLLEWHASQKMLDATPVILVPVPLSQERTKARGYNQAERIARRALRLVPTIALDTRMLVRVRDTLPQTSLGGQARRENLEGAFVAREPVATHTYIVFDDVLTTGATLEAAKTALIKAGATRVFGLALAHRGANATLSA